MMRTPERNVGSAGSHARTSLPPPEVVRFSLQPPRRRAAFLAIAAAVLLPYLFIVGQGFAAGWLAQREDLQRLGAAVKLEPGNAALHHRVGRQYLFAGDAAGAIPALLQAAALDAGNSRIWLDLGTAYQVTGDTHAQSEALRRALAADPRTPDVNWEVANFYFVSGDPARALELLKVVANSPARTAEVSALAWRATRDPEAVLAVLPPAVEPRLQLLDQLVAQNESAAADQVWLQVLQTPGQVKPPRLNTYFGSLLAQGRVTTAAAAWADAVNIAPELRLYQRSDNLVINPGFERNLLNGGFDWLTNRTEHVTAGADFVTYRSGQRSLAIQFDGGTPARIPVSQLIPVQPNTTYEVIAHLKSDSLHTASGPRLAVAAPGLLTVTSEAALGTTPWREYRLRFTTGATHEFVTLTLVRDDTSTRIKGALWLDDVLMVKR